MKLFIWFLYIYVDDSFSPQRRGETLYYERYSKFLPSNLTWLLRLWDYLGIPHEERKQIFGDMLPIIGFEVNPHHMLISMLPDSKSQLIEVLREFAQHGTCHSLRDFQHVAGHLNWALNVYPLLRPELCSLYSKTAGKLHQRSLIWVNRDVKRELEWVVNHLNTSNWVYILKSQSW
ncbi:hypothetical protein L210DRAFT_853145, partial [Boletus edulis BED1]